jgi:hypothetical protein
MILAGEGLLKALPMTLGLKTIRNGQKIPLELGVGVLKNNGSEKHLPLTYVW